MACRHSWPRPPRSMAANRRSRGSHILLPKHAQSQEHTVSPTYTEPDTVMQQALTNSHTPRDKGADTHGDKDRRRHTAGCARTSTGMHTRTQTKTNKCPEVLLWTDVEAHAHLGCLLDLPAWGHGNLAPVAPGRTQQTLQLSHSADPPTPAKAWAPRQPPPLALGLGLRPQQPRPSQSPDTSSRGLPVVTLQAHQFFHTCPAPMFPSPSRLCMSSPADNVSCTHTHACPQPLWYAQTHLPPSPTSHAS